MEIKGFSSTGTQDCLIIGDFTAQIGDPTGKLSTRKMLPARDQKEYEKLQKSDSPNFRCQKS